MLRSIKSLKAEIRDLREQLAELNNKPVQYHAVTHELRTGIRYYWRGDDEEEHADPTETRMQTVVLVTNEDGEADTVVFKGKWTLEQIKTAAGV